METYHFVFSEITKEQFKTTKGVNVTRESLELATEAFRNIYPSNQYKVEAIKLMDI